MSSVSKAECAICRLGLEKRRSAAGLYRALNKASLQPLHSGAIFLVHVRVWRCWMVGWTLSQTHLSAYENDYGFSALSSMLNERNALWFYAWRRSLAIVAVARVSVGHVDWKACVSFACRREASFTEGYCNRRLAVVVHVELKNSNGRVCCMLRVTRLSEWMFRLSLVLLI